MNFLYILLAIVVLLVLITIHELGHYVAGKIFGFKINEFAIGFGPKIFKRVNKKTGEIFSIRALPLGGFCAFEGEDEENSSPNAFNNKSPWRRLIVLVSGVLFNFIFAIITASIFLTANGCAYPGIDLFAPDCVNNGILQKGDIIQKIDGQQLEIYRTMSDITKNFKEGDFVTLTVERDGKVIEVKNVKFEKTKAFFFVADNSKIENCIYDKDGNLLTKEQFKDKIIEISPVYNEETKKYEDFSHNGTFFKKVNNTLEEYSDKELTDLAKITLSSPTVSMGFVYYNTQHRYGFFESLLKAWPFCIYMCGLILSALGGLFTGATPLSDVGGTITSISQMAQISQMGINSFLLMIPMISVNLALFNILPIPALDGARCVFVLIEWIFKKPVPRNVENWIHTIGLFVLLGLVVFLDVYHLFFL